MMNLLILFVTCGRKFLCAISWILFHLALGRNSISKYSPAAFVEISLGNNCFSVFENTIRRAQALCTWKADTVVSFTSSLGNK